MHQCKLRWAGTFEDIWNYTDVLLGIVMLINVEVYLILYILAQINQIFCINSINGLKVANDTTTKCINEFTTMVRIHVDNKSKPRFVISEPSLIFQK